MLRWDQSEVRHELAGRREATYVVDLTEERKSSKDFYPSKATEGLDMLPVTGREGEVLKIGIHCSFLGLQILKMFQLDSQGGSKRSFERLPEMREPQTMFFCPGGFAFGKDMAVITEDAGDPVHCGSDVDVIRRSQSKESSESFVVLRWYVNRGKVSAAI
jgi:hypothetical protein